MRSSARAIETRCFCPPVDAALADLRGVAFGQAGDEFVGLGGAGGFTNVFVGRVRVALADVVGNRAGEQHRFLQGDAHARA